MKKFLVAIKNESLYDLVEKGDDLILSYSKYDSNWTEDFRGERATKLHDFGDGITLKFEGKCPIRLDYGQLCELDIVLTRYFKTHNNHGKVTFAKFVGEKK